MRRFVRLANDSFSSIRSINNRYRIDLSDEFVLISRP
jgi:hypothetical protein